MAAGMIFKFAAFGFRRAFGHVLFLHSAHAIPFEDQMSSSGSFWLPVTVSENRTPRKLKRFNFLATEVCSRAPQHPLCCGRNALGTDMCYDPGSLLRCWDRRQEELPEGKCGRMQVRTACMYCGRKRSTGWETTSGSKGFNC